LGLRPAAGRVHRGTSCHAPAARRRRCKGEAQVREIRGIGGKKWRLCRG
jgi:hypothetical protein